MLPLPEYWIWDSWIADDGELYHLAAPLVQQRDGEWALIGFRNLEPEGSSLSKSSIPLEQAPSNQYQAVDLRAVAQRATITPEGPTVEEEAT